MNRFILCLALLILAEITLAGDFSVYEAGYPKIRDRNVNVTAVKDEVRLRGAYVEHTVSLTVSYDFNSWFFKNYSELEFQWKFKLPEEAIVFDFWFWYGDSLVQARVLDRWTAELLFNEVSSPFREPAIFTRSQPDFNGMVEYELRIFPIVRGKSQTFFFRYLVPIRPAAGQFRTWLPVSQITSRFCGADSLEIEVALPPQADPPLLVGKEEFPFVPVSGDTLYSVKIPVAWNEFVELVLPANIFGDFAIYTLQDSLYTYYQLFVYPPAISVARIPRNMLILIDYALPYTRGLDAELLFSSLKESLRQAFSAEDSVNIIVGYEEVVSGSSNWLAATQANLDTLFDRITGYRFVHFNATQELFAEAVRFLSRQKSPGEIVWITNRIDLPVSVASGEAYAHEIIDHFPPGTVFHILNLDNTTRLKYTQDYGYMLETYPFLSALTRETGGNLFFLRFHSLKNILDAIFFEKVSHFQEIEVFVRPSSGYTYETQMFSLYRGYYPAGFPVIQTGLLDGQFPAEVMVIGKTSDSLFVKSFTIFPGDVKTGPPQVATAWYGERLRKLSHKERTSWIINTMIDLSMKSRVLSAYTAYLVPNPEAEEYYRELLEISGESGRSPEGPIEVLVGNGRLPVDLFLLAAYPNPFNPETTLEIQVPRNLRLQEGDLLIFNVLGQVVWQKRVFIPQNGLIRIRWDARDRSGRQLPTGTYFVLFRVGKAIRKIKILFVR